MLKPGGLLVLDAPNIALIGGDDIVEEWFIDKHLYHFSARTLTRMIEAAGFDIVEQPDPRDRDQSSVRGAQDRTRAHRASRPIPPRSRAAEALIAAYRRNPRRQPGRADRGRRASSNGLKPQRVALWGAGRLFDTLVADGGFDPASLALLIDAHLIAHMAERHGVRLEPARSAGARTRSM